MEIRPQEERFLRLLEILGEWYERGKALIFVSSQEACDNLFRDLLKARHLYPQRGSAKMDKIYSSM